MPKLKYSPKVKNYINKINDKAGKVNIDILPCLEYKKIQIKCKIFYRMGIEKSEGGSGVTFIMTGRVFMVNDHKKYLTLSKGVNFYKIYFKDIKCINIYI